MKETDIKKHEPFQVLRTWPGKSLGTTHEYHELVKCPSCGHEFVRDISEGCFHHKADPFACPKCNYPWTYYQKLREKVIDKLKKPIPKEDPPFNPSARLQ